MDVHNEAVAIIAERVRSFYERKERFRIYHGHTNSTRKSPYTRNNIVDTSGLTHVLKIDTSSKTALCEPNVPMDALVASTLTHGLIPPVVAEFPGITIGGAFSGTAGESSSHKYGLIDATINRIEIVLANGDAVMASRAEDEHPELFHACSGACGTLGVVTLLDVQLIDARKYVELEYKPCNSLKESIETIHQVVHDPDIEYADGILFSKDRGVIMAGRLTDHVEPGIPVQGFMRPTDPWFYIHADRLTRNATRPRTVAVPVVDYFFRYDRGTFWGGMHAFNYFMVPFNRITRWLLDWYMHTRVVYHAFHKGGLADQTFVQDVGLPFSTVAEFIEYIDQICGFYPLWLCPVRQVNHEHRTFSMGNDLPPDKMLCNVGVWGLGPKDHYQFVEMNRKVENKVRELNGLKCLYAHAYYSEEEFWDIYDKAWYDDLRRKYHAESLPTVYDKVRVAPHKDPGPQTLLSRVWVIWPIRPVYGVLSATLGGEYLLPKQ